MQTEDGKLVIISGKSRSGKTAYTVQAVKKEPRVIAWDPDDQWAKLPGWTRITSAYTLMAAIQSSKPARIAFVPSGDPGKLYDIFCGCVSHWGRYYGACCAILEEQADVTSPGKAPGNHGMLIRRGLKRGITLYCISQRWNEADKTAFGNASEFVMFSMSSVDDMRYLAKKTSVPLEDITALKADYWDAECRKLKRGPYIRHLVNQGRIERGDIRFAKR